MAIPLDTLRDLQAFLLSDHVTVPGSKVPQLTYFLQALQQEEQAQRAQQAAAVRIRPVERFEPKDVTGG